MHGLWRICSEEIKSTTKSFFRLCDQIVASIQGAIHRMNVGDNNITSLLMSWEEFIEDNIDHAMTSFGCISGWLENYMKFDDDIC